MCCVSYCTECRILDCYISLFLRKTKQFVFDGLEQKMPIRVLVTLYSRSNMSYLREDITLKQSARAPARSLILLVQKFTEDLS